VNDVPEVAKFDIEAMIHKARPILAMQAKSTNEGKNLMPKIHHVSVPCHIAIRMAK
jgi:hypothetical protein